MLNLICPLNSTGFGISGLNIALALSYKAGDNLSLFPIGPLDIPDKHKPAIEELKANAGKYCPFSPCLRIWHQNDLAEFVGKGLHIGFPFFELDRFNARERHHLLLLDRIFVASHWAKNIVYNQLGESVDVRVVPLGVDRDIFHENNIDRLENDYTVFFNAGKWERRKGHDFLIKAFCKAFTPHDKVILQMLSYNPFIGPLNDQWAKEYLGSPLGMAGKIKLLPRLTTQEAVAKVMMAADCGVFPARAEGWNLELLEMMSLGKHVICTYATAHTEFITEKNARLIDVDEGDKEVAEDGIWFHGQGRWAKLGKPQEEQLIAHLREVHRLKQTGGFRPNMAGVDTAKGFSWYNTASKIIQGVQ